MDERMRERLREALLRLARLATPGLNTPVNEIEVGLRRKAAAASLEMDEDQQHTRAAE